MAQQQAIHKFVLGNKELEGKLAEFQYDRGWYSITDIMGEEREIIYKSRNAQEAYMKWNVYIGRKKERPLPEERFRKGSENDSHKENAKSQENGGERTERNGFGGNRGQKGHRNERTHVESAAGREERRDRRRNRADRSRRDREAVQEYRQ